MKAMHIVVGSTTGFDDYLRYEIDTNGHTTWPVPKQATPGDDVLFLIPAQHGSIRAKGTVLHPPVKSSERQGKYQTEIGNLIELKEPISITTLQEAFPQWGYPTYARGYTTVPEELVDALQQMLITTSSRNALLPEEVVNTEVYVEGATTQITVNAYERNAKARAACIKHYGVTCCICGFNFQETYGDMGMNFIHVHHLKPLAEIGEEYQLDPIRDLRPVCPNCHAMIHRSRSSPPYTIEEMRKLIQHHE